MKYRQIESLIKGIGFTEHQAAGWTVRQYESRKPSFLGVSTEVSAFESPTSNLGIVLHSVGGVIEILVEGPDVEDFEAGILDLCLLTTPLSFWDYPIYLAIESLPPITSLQENCYYLLDNQGVLFFYFANSDDLTWKLLLHENSENGSVLRIMRQRLTDKNDKAIREQLATLIKLSGIFQNEAKWGQHGTADGHDYLYQVRYFSLSNIEYQYHSIKKAIIDIQGIAQKKWKLTLPQAVCEEMFDFIDKRRAELLGARAKMRDALSSNPFDTKALIAKALEEPTDGNHSRWRNTQSELLHLLCWLARSQEYDAAWALYQCFLPDTPKYDAANGIIEEMMTDLRKTGAQFNSFEEKALTAELRLWSTRKHINSHLFHLVHEYAGTEFTEVEHRALDGHWMVDLIMQLANENRELRNRLKLLAPANTASVSQVVRFSPPPSPRQKELIVDKGSDTLKKMLNS